MVCDSCVDVFFVVVVRMFRVISRERIRIGRRGRCFCFATVFVLGRFKVVVRLIELSNEANGLSATSLVARVKEVWLHG